MAQRKKKSRLNSATVQEFERLRGQLKSFYDEFSILSKKNPNEPLNKFKLRLINDPLKKATELLGEDFKPIANFETFSDEDMPTTSDVGVVLSQYLTGMDRFKSHYTESDLMGDDVWLLEE